MAEVKKFKIVADTKGAEKGLAKTSKGLKDVGKSTKVSSKGFKAMGVAMKAMGIGLIIALVAKFTEVLMKNQKIQDLVARIMDTLSKVINILVDIMFEALKVIDKLTFGMLNLSGEADGATKSLQRQRNEFELMEAGMEKIKLQYETQIEKLRQVRDNEALTMEERINANNQIAAVLDQQHATEKAQIEEMIQIKRNLLKADKNNLELKKELLATETMLAELDQRITGQRSEQLTNVNSLKREQADLSKRSTKAIKKEVKSVEQMIAALDKYGGKLQKTDEQIHNENLQNIEEEFYKNINEIRERGKKKRKTEFDDDIKDTKKIIKNQENTLSKLYSQLGKASSEARKNQIRSDIAGYRENLKAQKRNLKILQENRENDLRNQGAYSEDEQKLLDFYKKKKQQMIDDYNKKVTDAEKKQADKVRKINEDALKLANEDQLSAFAKEFFAIEEKYRKILEQEELGEEERKALRERMARDKQALEDKYEDEAEQKQKERNQKTIDAALSVANSLVSISATSAQKEIKELDKKLARGLITEDQYNKRKTKIENDQLKKEKAATLLQIGVDTARGISGAVAAGAGLTFPANLAAIASGVASVIAGIASASAALGQSVDTPEPSLEDDSGGFGNESLGQQASVTFGAIGADAPPIQAYVVESDVSGSQALQEDLDLQATL
jgi:hypothetical protein